MKTELNLAFIGGGNMASALASGLIGKRCAAHNIHIIDIQTDVLEQWRLKGVSVAFEANEVLASHRVWIFSVKPQFLKEAVQACRPFLQDDTLVISVAAGISGITLSQWLGSPDQPWTRLVRCMPNTPALIGAGAAGLFALDGVTDDDKHIADQLLQSVGQAVWVNSDAEIDAVTALSGSGPAYVFLFLQALIEGALDLGLSADQARTLALATVEGSTQLARQSADDLVTLRQRVTSKGGTTAAALEVLDSHAFAAIVQQAVRAAHARAGELSDEFSQ